MKITCQACAAKYTIADEKVLGKIVKIRCKKCGATIIVNGNDPTASAGSEPPHAHDPSSLEAPGEGWTVNVADGDQRSMSDSEIADAYRTGLVGDDTFCWKDGMADWLPLQEIAPLYAVCRAPRATAGAARPVAAAAEEEEDDATKIQDAVSPALLERAPPRAGRPAAGFPGNGAPASAAAPSAAARRAGGRAPAADLFSGAARAGGDEDVMTSAPAGMPRVHDDPAKLTGQRNENSVLFSLNALTSKGPPSTRPATASSEASGLIDIRQLSAQIGMGEDSKKRSRVDDIMNLSGGGAFSASLSAPVLSAPAIEEYAPPASTAVAGSVPAAGGKSKALIFGAVGAGALVVIGAVGVAVMVMGKSDAADKDKASASASASAGPIPSASAAMAAPSATGAAPTAAATAPTATAAATTEPPAPPATTTKTVVATTPAAETPTTAPTKVATNVATAHPAAAPAAGAADQPFNMGEARARLAGIAGSVQACKKGDVSGTGRVVITFAPGGNVASAVVSGPPFAGTAAGACVASRFRGAHVPAFAGSPFSVSKSFTIN